MHRLLRKSIIPLRDFVRGERRGKRKYVVMLHEGRCGSQVLGNMLDEHGDIHWAGEIFEPHMGVETDVRGERLLQRVIDASRASGRSKVYGLEIKYLSQLQLSDQCLDMDLGELVASLRALGFTYFIVLHRMNHLRRTVSAQVGRKQGKWHSCKKADKPTRVRIDVDSVESGRERKFLLDVFADMDRDFKRVSELLADQALFMTYEDDVCADPRAGYEKICTFLGVECENPEISLRRTNPFSYEQIVENFDDVKAVLRGTQYEWMLDQ